MRLLLPMVVVLLLAIPAPAGAAGFELVAPIPGPAVRGYDDVGRFAAGHRGVDLGGSTGDPVRAAAAGRVLFAGNVAGRGTVSVDHGNGWRTTYQPVLATVGAGDVVEAGDAIGSLLAGHCAGACLHWGLTDGETYANPLAFLRLPPVRLVPAGSAPPPLPRIAAATVGALDGLPLRGRLTSRFGPRLHPVLGVFRLHDGVDLAAPCGTPVVVPNGGTVTRVDHHPAYGRRVVVDHGGGRATGYTHLQQAHVRRGQVVAGGDRIGTVGSSGLSTGCHLHWMAWRDGAVVDPMG
ncbi:peptidoglycan DD-metalloendopeptidase family protein [Tessaracoccus flavus]|uniref:M23ase beta-sheet core domain-containing protein n=1 Tax=Tessaracoccus flavus TaxID=1610493 RepID=A0A1Q2CDG4_9ACTN|nr:peptidoglycan DD-metalloendopeptidase family protein [Tessaracoccus flavus]AQP44162.1 hypothetical protein RPIT_04490 [Tessaracoccus flavus]SDY37003.1 Peptidase family M23 [Tessaracoccus flavus]